MDLNIREPKQKRAIEKKEKIIDAGFELICENGYHNVNTAEIAKKAGVSTGIIYQYFKDKHDIFLAGIYKYGDDIFFPFFKAYKDKNIDRTNFSEIIKNTIKKEIDHHKLSKTAHEEIMSMTHSDKDIEKYYKQKEIDITIKLADLLKSKGFKEENLNEKVHVVIGMIDNICHEVVYHKHEELNYDTMTEIVLKNIIKVLED